MLLTNNITPYSSRQRMIRTLTRMTDFQGRVSFTANGPGWYR